MSWYSSEQMERRTVKQPMKNVSGAFGARLPEPSKHGTLAGMKALVNLHDELSGRWTLPCLFLAADHGAWAKMAGKLPASYRVPDVSLWRSMVDDSIAPPPSVPRHRKSRMEEAD